MTKQSQYKKELKYKRNSVLINWLEKSGYTRASFINEFGRNKLDELERKFRPQLIRSQNRIRGLVGEFLGSEYLTNSQNVSIDSVIKDKKLFETPLGNRRIDVYNEEKGICIEVKMGYLYNSSKIKNQIEKDRFLLENNIVNKVIWILYQDGSINVKSNIKNSGFELIVGGQSGTEVVFENDVDFILPNLQVINSEENRLSINPIDDGGLVYVIYHLQKFFNIPNIPNDIVISWQKIVKPTWMKNTDIMKQNILKWLELNKIFLMDKLEYDILKDKLTNKAPNTLYK